MELSVSSRLEIPQLPCNHIRVFRYVGTQGNSRDITKSSQIRLTKAAVSWRLMPHDHGIWCTSEVQRTPVRGLSAEGKTPAS